MKKLFWRGLVMLLAAAWALAAPDANADAGSYLAAARVEPALAGISDPVLMLAGTRACAGIRPSGIPSLDEPVIRLARKELCP